VTKPPKQSAAGGAKYHAIKATAKWKEFQDAIMATATHTAAERADRDRERAGRTTYGEAERAKREKG
jgi:hypothetical protein